MYEFEYVAPASLSEAKEALTLREDAKLLAGGMSLLSAMKLRLNRPSQLIDLRRIDALKGIRHDGQELVIGAMTRHADVAASALVQQVLPALSVLAGGIGDRQVRNRGTIGGSLANNDPAACYPGGLMGLGGRVVTDRRAIDADAFVRGLFETALEDDEVITEVRFRVPQKAAYVKWKQPASRFALVGVMVVLQGDGRFRVGVTGAKAHAYRETLIEQLLNAGGQSGDVRKLVLPTAELNADLHADAAYRGHLVVEMAARVFEQLRHGAHEEWVK